MRLWSCGFELQSVTSGVEWDTTTLSPTIDTTIKRSGAASLHCNTTTTRAFIRHQFTASSSAIFFARFWIYIVAYPSSISGGPSASEIIIGSFGPANDYSGYVTLSTTGTLRMRDFDDALQIGPSSALSLNEWHCIEISHQDTGGNLELRVNGSSVGTATGANLTAITTFAVGMGANMFGAETATGEFYLDDIAINDSSGASQTSWPGNTGKIVHMHPDWAGDAAATTGVFSALDEVTPNDATDYVEQDTIAAFNYNFEASSVAGIGASDTITLVQIGTRQHPETAASAEWTPQIKSSLVEQP